MASCFVVQGFGKKTDFTDGRVLDLDASYAIIKEAVEGAELECIRADEIVHSGTIDAPMYKQLLQADLVIADLSTYNVNAAFELGVRYGLRPRATIIVAEEGFKNPFDVGHIVIRRYKHLGEDIGAKEAKRFRDDLKQAITDILAKGDIDSPVYTFLPELSPPLAESTSAKTAARDSASFSLDKTTAGLMLMARQLGAPPADVPIVEDAPVAPSAKDNLDQAQAKLMAGDFSGACDFLREVRKQRPNDSFVIQQLALATYKSRLPTPEAALNEAREILLGLNPANTNDPETLGLWGAVHKRQWEITHLERDLNESIEAYARGFHLKQDYYNGINLAFLLEVRALTALKAGDRDEGITDSVLARRTRQEVIKYAEPMIDKDYGVERRYWILATLWEAAAGLGDTLAAEKWAAQARALKMADWMTESTQTQIQKILDLQAEIARLGRLP